MSIWQLGITVLITLRLELIFLLSWVGFIDMIEPAI